ncbi:RDD family protein [Jeotgalibacillus alimentarius]|uniref:RDD family protein n=1 Tax=Jeotgalibacillus alimentarius TaxID=135826 RepID=A0A0C2W5S9_9BACL|nr:RDD family protein [Jeotgalibacillus alimentarius]KIL51393.1 RDD family protein [Jeotgalibacillus alimentarius]
MKEVTKRRFKAILIDLAVSSAVTAGVEYVLRKKVKNEAFHALVTPTAVMWGLELAQLKSCGQTVGYKAMGLKLESEDGFPLTTEQLLKRMAYRDTIGGFKYMKDKEAYVGTDGRSMAHDRYAAVVVNER